MSTRSRKRETTKEDPDGTAKYWLKRKDDPDGFEKVFIDQKIGM